MCGECDGALPEREIIIDTELQEQTPATANVAMQRLADFHYVN